MGSAKHQPKVALRPFDKLYAPMVARWVDGEAELFQLAPGTQPPLTAAKVVGWTSTGACPLLLWAENDQDPCGYAELNGVSGNPDTLWLGHLLLRPDLRGQGWGGRFVELLVAQAFERMGATSLVLVVFPENEPAIRCYLGHGFVVRREEFHRFAGRKRHRMLRMELAHRASEAKSAHESDRVAAR